MGWLLAAAFALTLLVGWCASAEAALARVSRAGAKELGRTVGEGSTPLQVVLADVARYLTVVLYVAAGIVPRSLGQRSAVRVATVAASMLAPITRLLGPLSPGGGASRG